MSNEEKYKKALEEILDQNGECYDTVYDIKVLAREALKPEFEPIVGMLYKFVRDADTCYDIFVADVTHDENTSYLYEGAIAFYHRCYQLTEQEWKDLGAPIIEVNKTIPLPPQLTITEDEAKEFSNAMACNFHFNSPIRPIVVKLLKGAKVEPEIHTQPMDMAYNDLAKECMDACLDYYIKDGLCNTSAIIDELGKKIKEAKANE